MLSDLIAALATPPGRSALAVVRLSGRGAFDLARRVLRWPNDRPLIPRQAQVSTAFDETGDPFDQLVATFFPSPASYTGEDLVEFGCHGGLLAPAQLLAVLHRGGARPAGPGEFTRRAVLNGKLDLLQAEAVGDLIDATTAAQGRGALRQMHGGLSRRLEALRYNLTSLLALLSYDIDFPEEDDGPVDRASVRAGLAENTNAVERLLATALIGERVRRGALVVLAGRPNAGKSSLFNALLGSERALVAEMPGTTRDTIEADLDLIGWPVRLADTAGLRPSSDLIERMGIEVSRRYLAAADLVVLCVEAGLELNSEEQILAAEPRTLVVRTKGDLAAAPGLTVSAMTRVGLENLEEALVSRLFGAGRDFGDLEPMLTRERHRASLDSALEALREAAPHFVPGGDVVLGAHHVRRAVASLDELIGPIDIEEVLGAIFSRFCVGK